MVGRGLVLSQNGFRSDYAIGLDYRRLPEGWGNNPPDGRRGSQGEIHFERGSRSSAAICSRSSAGAHGSAFVRPLAWPGRRPALKVIVDWTVNRG